MILVVILVAILAVSSRRFAHFDSRGDSGSDSRGDSGGLVSTVCSF